MMGEEAFSWLKMLTRKIKTVTVILPDIVQESQPAAGEKKIFHLHLIRMALFIWALGPGTTCWPGGGSEMLSRGGGVKNGLQGGRIATYPPHAHLWAVLNSSYMTKQRVNAKFHGDHLDVPPDEKSSSFQFEIGFLVELFYSARLHWLGGTPKWLPNDLKFGMYSPFGPTN